MNHYSKNWVQHFAKSWDIFQWLDEYGEVRTAKHFSHDTTFTAPHGLNPAVLPDATVSFNNHDDTVACFFIDGESFTQLINETSPNGRVAKFFWSYPTLTNPDTDERIDLDAVLLVSQFSLFGKFLSESLPVTNTHVNPQNNIQNGDDFGIHLYGGIFNHAITATRTSVGDSFTDTGYPSLNDVQHGILTGTPFEKKLFSLPTGLVSPKPDAHDFEHPYWKYYNQWY